MNYVSIWMKSALFEFYLFANQTSLQIHVLGNVHAYSWMIAFSDKIVHGHFLDFLCLFLCDVLVKNISQAQDRFS